MSQTNLLGAWVRRFLLEYLVGERNLARNTQRSYRDTLRLLIPFAAGLAGKPVDLLEVEEVSPDRIRAFLRSLTDERGCSAATVNQRLAAIHSLAQFIALRSPERIQWAGGVRAIRFKKTSRPLVVYLEKNEMDAMLAAPDPTKAQGERDHALLVFLYNTGARADEVAHVRIGDLEIASVPTRDLSSVTIHGKGNKQRRCPLWRSAVEKLIPIVEGRGPDDFLFLNRYGRPLTRFGIYGVVARCAAKAARTTPSLGRKRVSPHVIRHTTATHLLRSGVDINTIRAWLGHVSLATTNIYAHVDLEAKATALANCEIGETASPKAWREDADLMGFLRGL